MATKPIITGLSSAELKVLQKQVGRAVILVKLGAKWCQPCKMIKPTCEAWYKTCPANIVYADVDIDDSPELYAAFKKHKMVRGVPTLFAFNGAAKRDHWFLPDDSVVGGDLAAVTAFLGRCTALAKAL